MEILSGLLLFRYLDKSDVEILLVRPGGIKGRDDLQWSLPKGHVNQGESLLEAAKREFSEETHSTPPEIGPYISLGSLDLKPNKQMYVFALQTNSDLPDGLKSVTMISADGEEVAEGEYYEIDKVEYFSLSDAHKKLESKQWPFVSRLLRFLQLI